MALTPASVLADYSSGIGTQGATLKVNTSDKRVGIGTTNPQGTLQVGTGITMGSGIITATAADFSGNVTVGGELTYEDVTNVDSVGVITARSGIEVGSGVTITTTNVNLADNGKIQLGDDNDLQIYHDENNSYIDDTGGGQLNIRGNTGVSLRNYSNSNQFINCYTDGTVELFYNNSKKFETITTGVKVTGALEVTQEYPTIRPTLDLNFAATKTLDRRITFTRDGVGTFIDELGIIRYASNNVPRFDHDPTTGESLGLLIEESRSNSWTYSQPTSDISFGSSATKTFNAATAPNGETEAFRITHNGSAGNSNWRATRAINFNADEMVLSVWAKGNGGNNYFLWSFQNLGGAIVRAGFKLEGDGETSIITDGNGGHTLQIEKYPDGWYRCIIIGNTDSSGSTTQFLYTASNYSESSSISGGSTLLWGFQLEEGAFATSYIPTSGTTVTRAADKAKITGTNFTDFFNQTEGTIKCSYWLGNDTTGLRVFQINDSDNSVIDIVAGSGSGSGGYGYINTGGVAQANGGQSSANDSYRNTLHVTTLAYKENDVAGINIKTGVLTTDTSAALDGAYNRVTFYQGNGETAFLNGRIQQVSYYPKRLPNAQLQGLTQQ